MPSEAKAKALVVLNADSKEYPPAGYAEIRRSRSRAQVRLRQQAGKSTMPAVDFSNNLLKDPYASTPAPFPTITGNYPWFLLQLF